MNPSPPKTTPLFRGTIAAAFTNNQAVTAVAVSTDGRRLAAIAATDDHGPGALFIAPDGTRLLSFAATDRTPELIVVDDVTMILDNRTANGVDIGVLLPSGETKLLRNVSLDAPTATARTSLGRRLAATTGDDLSSVLRAAALLSKEAACAAARAEFEETGGSWAALKKIAYFCYVGPMIEVEHELSDEEKRQFEESGADDGLLTGDCKRVSETVWDCDGFVGTVEERLEHIREQELYEKLKDLTSPEPDLPVPGQPMPGPTPPPTPPAPDPPPPDPGTAPFAGTWNGSYTEKEGTKTSTWPMRLVVLQSGTSVTGNITVDDGSPVAYAISGIAGESGIAFTFIVQQCGEIFVAAPVTGGVMNGTVAFPAVCAGISGTFTATKQ